MPKFSSKSERRAYQAFLEDYRPYLDNYARLGMYKRVKGPHGLLHDLKLLGSKNKPLLNHMVATVHKIHHGEIPLPRHLKMDNRQRYWFERGAKNKKDCKKLLRHDQAGVQMTRIISDVVNSAVNCKAEDHTKPIKRGKRVRFKDLTEESESESDTTDSSEEDTESSEDTSESAESETEYSETTTSESEPETSGQRKKLKRACKSPPPQEELSDQEEI